MRGIVLLYSFNAFMALTHNFTIIFYPVSSPHHQLCGYFSIFMPRRVLQILQLKPTACTVFHKDCSTCFGQRRSIIRKALVEYKHYGDILMSKCTWYCGMLSVCIICRME